MLNYYVLNLDATQNALAHAPRQMSHSSIYRDTEHIGHNVPEHIMAAEHINCNAIWSAFVYHAEPPTSRMDPTLKDPL